VLYAFLFVVVVCLLYLMSLVKGPIWGLFAYACVYFICPLEDINWWAMYLPNFRWSLLSAVVVLISLFLHREQLSVIKFPPVTFLILFLLFLSGVLTLTVAVSSDEALYFTKAMFGYCVAMYIIVKITSGRRELLSFLLCIILLCVFLGIQSLLSGEFVHGRLDNIGPADANSSNAFGLMMSAILPLTFPFLIFGTKIEKGIVFLSLPFLVNAFTLTVSRGAFVSLAFGLCYSFLAVADQQLRKYFIIVVVCLIPFVAFSVDDKYVERISTLWTYDNSTDDSYNEVSSGRTAIWGYGIKMASDYPFGSGPGGFKGLSHLYMPDQILVYHHGDEVGQRAAHNSYLQTLVELGYLGLAAFLLLGFGALNGLRNSYKQLHKIGQGKSFLGLLLVSLSVSIASTLFGGLVGSMYYNEFFWWLIAIHIVVRSLADQVVQYSEIKNGAANGKK